MIHMKAFLSFVLVTSIFFGVPVGAKENSEKKGKEESYEREHDKDHKQEHEDEKAWSFKVSKTQGDAPLVVTFDASGIKPAKKFYWSFGNGDKLVTDKSMVTYQYKVAGTYTASLKFAVNASEKEAKELKEGGSVVIKVLKETPPVNRPPVAALSCSVNNLLVACSGITSYDPENQPLIFKFDFADGFTETNTTGLSSHAYSVPGLYNVQLSVFDSAGASGTAAIQAQAVKPPNKLPVLALNCASDKINILKCDALGTTDSDGTISSFSYAWDDNLSDSKADATAVEHVFSVPGTHSATLTVVDNDGGVSTLTKTFAVKADSNPLASFSCDNSEPQKLTCHSNSTDPDAGDTIQSYTWKFGASAVAVTTTTPDVDYLFSAGGNIAVTLVVTDSYGGVGSVAQAIAVKNNTPPVANFSCTNTGVRAIHCESSSSDSDGLISSTTWSLDDGTNLTGTRFDHTFSDDQAHVINLAVTDELGASTSLNQTVQPIQNQAPQGSLVASTLSGDAPLVINFTAQDVLDSDGTIAAIDWSFSDGGIASGAIVSHTFNNTGTFTATMKLTDNLGAVTTKSVSITSLESLKTPPEAFFKIFEFDTLVELHANITKTQFDIKRAYYTIDGNQTVELTEFYPNTINLVDLLNFGEHRIDLTVVDVRGQITTFTHKFTQAEDLSLLNPYVDFKAVQSSPRSTFISFLKSFNFDEDKGIKNFHIDYGNGESEDTSNLYLTHTYPAAGTYQVTVQATSSDNTTQSITHEVVVTDNDVPIIAPIAKFGYRIYDYAQNVSFYNDRSGTPNGSIISYMWDFGDGQSGTGQRVAHFYEPGSYFVTLSVVDSAGLRSSETQHITIFKTGDNLVANIDCSFSPSFIEYTQTCQVTAVDKLNQINKIRVAWGDGGAFFLTPAQAQLGISKYNHNYSSVGNFLPTLTVFTSRGETKVATTSLNLANNPSAQAPVAVLNCTSNLLQVDCSADGSSDPNNLLLSYTISWGDGNNEVSTGAMNLSHTYIVPGPYVVTMTAKNSKGLVSTVKKNVSTFDHAVIANIYCQTNNLLVNCNTFGSYDVTGKSLIFTFDYGDSFSESNSTGISSHAYSSAGLFTVSVKVTNANGDNSSAQTQVQTLIPPNQIPVAFLDCFSNSPYILRCNGTNSRDSDGTIVSYKYEWDDGTSETHADGSEIFHVFSNGGTHKITLITTDNDGGVNSLTSNFDVQFNHPPVAAITCLTPGPQRIACYSNSYEPDPNDTIVEYKWNLGDGTIVTSLIPFIDHTYLSASSSYSISLDLKDSYGASSSVSQSLSTAANQDPVVTIDCHPSGLQTINCNSFSYDPDGSISNTHWELDDGATFDESSFTHTFTSGAIHNAKLTLTDNLGKTVIAIQEFQVPVNLLPNFDLAVSNLSGNLPFTTHFEAQNVVDPDGTIVSYKWIFDDGTTSDKVAIDHTFTKAGDYSVKLQVTDNNNGMTEKSVIIRASDPSNLIITTDKDNGIADLVVHLDASQSTDPDGQIVKFEWFYQGEKIGEGEQVDYEFDLSGNQFIELVATNNFGIQTKIGKVISVFAPPIYLEGIISNTGFVNKEYKANFNLKLSPSINPDNITFELSDAPVGVSFDSDTKQLSWIPTSDEKGEVLFYLNVTDGVLNYRRKFKISVYELEPIASINTLASGGIYKIQAPGTPIDNAQVTLPENSEPYTLNLSYVKDSSQTILNADSSVPLNKPLTIDFPQTVGSYRTVSDFNLESNSVEPDLNPVVIYQEYNREIVCAEDLKNIKTKNLLQESKFDFDKEASISALVYFEKEINIKDLRYQKWRKILMNNNLNVDGLKIYVIDRHIENSKLYRNGVLGFHFPSSEDSIYLNIGTGIEEFSDSAAKFSSTHESFHVSQTRALGCLSQTQFPRSGGLYNLIEGSADYYALKRMSGTERIKVIQENLYVDRLEAPYAIGLDISFMGLFDSGSKLYPPPALNFYPYDTRIYWDYLNFEPINFFKNFGQDLEAVKNIQQGTLLKDDILRVLKNSAADANVDIGNSLLRLTDELNNSISFANSSSEIITPILKDSSNFLNWDLANEINNFIPEGDEITVQLPAMSGDSNNFYVKDLISTSSTGPADLITIEYPDNPDIKLNARVIVQLPDGTVQNSARVFTEKYSSGSGTKLLEGKISSGNKYDRFSSYDMNEKIIFNIVNSGSSDLPAKIKISSKCIENCLSISISTGLIFPKTSKTIQLNPVFPAGYKVYNADMVYSWDFGDGSTSTLESPLHSYANYGQYSVFLRVQNKITKEVQTTTKQILVEPDPSISIVPNTSSYTFLKLIKDNCFDYFGRPIGSCQAGLLHKRSSQFIGQGPVGSVLAIGGGEVHVADCGEWTKIDDPFVGLSCQRGAGTPVTTTIFKKEIDQCGGEGCIPLGLMNSTFFIPFSVDDLNNAGEYHFTGNLPAPFDF